MRASWPGIVGLSVVVSGCGLDSSDSSSGSGSCSAEIPQHSEDEAVGWKCIGPQGGRVDAPDGAWLDVPAGALGKSVRITIKVPSPSSGDTRVYKLEPSGLEFAEPVVLHSPHAPLAPGKTPIVGVMQSSSLQETVSVGSELTDWEPVNTVEHEPATSTFAASLEHFSIVYFFMQVDELAYLVPDVPLKYLEAGDILMVLTNRDETEGQNWNPGHVGMLFTANDSGSVGQVIESSPPEGVQKNGVDAFRVDYGHLYLGARKVAGPELTVAERTSLVNYATAQTGKGYSKFGEGNFAEGSFSCIGLVEAAYDTIDRGTIPWNGEFFAILPLEMMRATHPITDVHERTEQPVAIPVYGVTVASGSPYFGTSLEGFYQRTYNYTIAATSKPDGSSFTGDAASGYLFEWTPQVEDGCVEEPGAVGGQKCPPDGQPHLLVLEMSAAPHATFNGDTYALGPVKLTETVTVHVTSHSRLFEITPAGPLAGKTIEVKIPLPPRAKFKATVLRDEATKQAPSFAPYAGHTLEVVTNGFNQTTQQAELTIYLKNNTAFDVTGAPITLRFTLDYERDRFHNF